MKAHGTLAYRLEELGRLDEAVAAFEAGIDAGDRALQSHLDAFLRRHSQLSHRSSTADTAHDHTRAAPPA
jgi:hypothetical protein